MPPSERCKKVQGFRSLFDKLELGPEVRKRAFGMLVSITAEFGA